MPVLVTELDLHEIDVDTMGDRDEAQRQMAVAREHHWLARLPMGYAVVGHEAITKVLPERRFHQLLRILSEVRGLDPRLSRDGRESILTAEGKEHQRLRRLVSPAFTPRSADRLRPIMRATIKELLDNVASSGRVEAIAELCDPYPIPIICELLGAPKSDWENFSRWAGDVLSIFDGDANDKVDTILKAREELDSYVTALIERRRDEPADDLLTDLIAAEQDGDRLDAEELLTMVEAVLVAGVDTTRNQLGCAPTLFATRPDDWAKLAEDPAMAPRALEETMRYLGAIRGTGRYASVEIELDGVIFPEGRIVLPSFTSGNRDPSVHENAGEFDMARDPSAPHLTFGSGIHHCLGAFLAKAELQEALPLLAKRLPDLALEGDVVWKPPTTAIWGPQELNLTFTPT